MLARLNTVLLVVSLTVPFAFAQNSAPLSADDALAKLQHFEHGQPVAPLHAVERMLAQTADPAARAALAARLAALLADPVTTLDAKGFLCKQLPLLAGEAEVAVMVRLLDDPKTFEMGRAALEATPLPSALAALRGALLASRSGPKRTGGDRVGIANSLGNRRDAAAVPALTPLLADADAKAACAAAVALGRIATPAACAALSAARGNATGELLDALRDAQLEAAEATAAKDPAAAGALYETLWNDTAAKQYRLPALRGLLSTRKDQAVPQLLQALDGPDTSLYPVARSLAGEIPGEAITKLLVIELGKLAGDEKAALVDALARRKDPAARPAVMALLDADDPAVQLAAVRAMAELGDASCVQPLAKIAAGSPRGAGGKTTGQGARLALARLKGGDIDATILALAEKGEPAIKVAAMQALADRKAGGASAVLLKNAADADAAVASAALAALATVGEASTYDKLIALLASRSGLAGAKDEQADAARKAVLAVAQRLADPSARLAPVLAALKDAKGAARGNLLRALGGLGTAEALPAVRAALKDADSAIIEAGVRALADWPDPSAAADLLDLAAKAPVPAHRVLAMRGYLRIAATAKIEPADRARLFQQARQVATTAESKKMLLGGLMDAPDAGALELAVAYLDDKDVHAEAVQSALALGQALANSARQAVQDAMMRIEATSKDKKVLNEARAVVALTRKPLSADELAKFLGSDPARSAATKKVLAGQAPAGYAVVAYLDCGADRSDGKAPGPTLRLTTGQSYFWPGADTVAPIRFGSISYTGDGVEFEAANLKADRAYQVGLAWWDFDHNDRVQSLWAVGKDGRKAELVKKTKLPSYLAAKEMPQELTVAIPREITAGGTCRLQFHREGGTNVVVSELWLLEAIAASPAPPAPPASTPAPAPAPAAAWPAPKNDKPKEWAGEPEKPVCLAPAPAGAVKVLIVTGDDMHNWKATAPVLADLLAKDSRLHVSIAWDARFLADKALADYDVIVLHYVKWNKPDLAQPCLDNLKDAVAAGKGLVVVHFACGAFQKWDEFVKLAGRVYNPKLRGHDPHGTFTVRMTDAKHPITDGLKEFQTLDELYTCLDGQTDVQVLATATSKVDKKDYPMAIVLTCGKGRVFHCPLGHDTRAFESEGVQELFRRGTAWAAGKTPTP